MSDHLSKAALKQLGKRLRATVSSEDLDLLDDYRRRFDPSLISMNASLVETIRSLGVDALVSGRIKRTKSIVRKLQREASMDLSRMTDVAGLRVVVRTMEDQAKVMPAIEALVEKPRLLDRRTEKSGYRSVHITGLNDNLPIEIQLRTIPQQVWANESESLGEQVKEGGGTRHEQEYLQELSVAISKIEQERDGKTPNLTHALAISRRPFEYRLPWVETKFEEAIAKIDKSEVSSELLIFDGETSDIIKSLKFHASERILALEEFERLSRELDPVRYDVLILNTTSHAALCVTHPRFYL